MPTRSIMVGVALIVLGVFVTIASDSGSVTSLIPAFVGVVFVALGVLARFKPGLSHHAMHGSAAIAMLAILGSLGSLVGRGSTGWALFAQAVTVVLCGAFLYVAIISFREARRARAS